MKQSVLYLPGLDGESNVLPKLQPHLSAVDLVPFSYPTGRDFEWQELADVVAARLVELESGLLIGESFGGAVALKTALLKPRVVSGLCLIAAFSSNPEPLAAALGRTATRMLPRSLMKPVARLLAGWKLAGTLSGDDREKFLERYANLDYRDIAARLRLLHNFDVDDRVIGLHCPVDVIFGSADPISASSAQQDIWRRIPDVRLHQLDAYGHLVTHEVPLGVACRISGWIDRIEAARGE